MIRFKPLSEITRPKQWKNLPISKLKEVGYPVYGANGIIGYYDEYNHKYPTIAITCRGATCGSIHITKPKAYITSNAMSLDNLNAKICDQNYLAKYLQFRGLTDVTTGAAQPQITRANLERVKIPLLQINDQIRIATLLSRIEALIATRKENLLLLDQFLKSTFLEMFGDPVRNVKGWDVKKVGDILSDIESGWSPKCEARPATKDEWGVLKLSAVTYGTYNDSENKALPNNITPKPEKQVYVGDLLFTRKNTYALVGASAYVFQTKPKLMMPDLIFRLVIKDEQAVKPLYLWMLLRNERQRQSIQRLAGGAAGSMPNISKAKLRTVNIILPPRELQKKFSEIVKKVESIKSLYQQNLYNLENLYGSLSQKAFKGELDLSQIPLPDKEPKEETIETPPVYTKSAPDIHETELTYLKTNIKEQQFLCSLFNTYLNSYKEKTFTLDDYFFYWSHSENTHNKTFGLADYELIKKWLYQLINNGTIQQVIDNEKNQLVLKLNG